MAVSNAIYKTNDQNGQRVDTFVATVGTAGTLNGSVEGMITFPPSGADGVTAGNGWDLVKTDIMAGVNTTHTTTVSITATVEKNTDGGTSALTTAPILLDTAGTGRRTTVSAGTGITVGVPVDGAAGTFADSDVAFVTLTEAGTGGADPSDVCVRLVFARQQDFDPEA